MAAVAGSPRELTVWIWYPAAEPATGTTVEYMPAPLRAALERHMGPILKNFLTHDLASEPETEVAAIRQRIDSAAARLPNRPAVLTLLGSRHFNFSDMALTKNTRAARTFRMLGPIDERRALEIAADSIRTFFDTHLKGKPDRLGAMPAKYPEIRVGDSP